MFASGGLRFRLNSWFPIAQVGGGFESGLRNRTPLELSYDVRTGDGTIPELSALGVEYVVVHGPKSREHYRDFRNPRKFDGLLEAVWREEDDVIYRVPFSSLAHADSSALSVAWRGASELQVEGRIPEGAVVSLAVNYDPGWEASQGGRPIAIEQDRHGFMTLRVNPGEAARVDLRYRGTVEQRVMGGLSALCWVGSIAALALKRRVDPLVRGWPPGQPS